MKNLLEQEVHTIEAELKKIGSVHGFYGTDKLPNGQYEIYGKPYINLWKGEEIVRLREYCKKNEIPYTYYPQVGRILIGDADPDPEKSRVEPGTLRFKSVKEAAAEAAEAAEQSSFLEDLKFVKSLLKNKKEHLLKHEKFNLEVFRALEPSEKIAALKVDWHPTHR